jgi:hypothetical protein
VSDGAKSRPIVLFSTLLLLVLLLLGYLGNIAMRNRSPVSRSGGPHRIYVTKFPVTEFPISEGGRWVGGHSLGLDWSDVGTLSGHTYGAVISPGYDDPTALLTGSWEPDQMARGVVFSLNQVDTPNGEVELRLRSALAAHLCTGYEITWRVFPNRTAYMGIARWNGRLGDWTDLGTHYGAKFGVSNGDVIEATAIGNVISAYKNGVLQARVKDNAFPTGSPGMGTDWAQGVDPHFGLSEFMASDQMSEVPKR